MNESTWLADLESSVLAASNRAIADLLFANQESVCDDNVDAILEKIKRNGGYKNALLLLRDRLDIPHWHNIGDDEMTQRLHKRVSGAGLAVIEKLWNMLENEILRDTLLAQLAA